MQLEFKKQGRDEDVLKECFTLELGSEECISKNDASMQTQGVLNYLKHKDIINSTFAIDRLNSEVIHHDIANYKHIKATEGRLYEWFVKAGDSFKVGDVIGQYIQTSTMTRKDLAFPCGGTIISISMKGAACQGSALMNLAIS